MILVKGTILIIQHSYYFGDCALRVWEEKPFLTGIPLSRFERPLPFRCEINLSIAASAYPPEHHITNLAEAPGIKIGQGEHGDWVFTGCGQYPCRIEANCNCSRLKGYLPDGDEIRFLQLLRVAAECCLTHDGGVSLHASCVVLHGQSVLFTAPAGTGKSTQASLWREKLHAEILSGDRPLLRFLPNELRAYGVPWDGKEQIFIQDSRPVRAIVEVRQAKRNSVRQLSRDQAFRLLLNQCFIPVWDDNAEFHLLHTLRYISDRVPFYRLFCLPDEDAAELLSGVLFKNNDFVCGGEQPDMKLKEGFVLRNIVDEWIVMPTGTSIKNFEGAIVLNDVSAFIWGKLEDPISRDDLLAAVTGEYDIDEQTAADDLDELLKELEKLELLQKG